MYVVEFAANQQNSLRIWLNFVANDVIYGVPLGPKCQNYENQFLKFGKLKIRFLKIEKLKIGFLKIEKLNF